MIKPILTFLTVMLWLSSPAQLYNLTSSECIVYFDSDSYQLDKRSKEILFGKILEIGSTNVKEILVEGHTDSFATHSYNDVLAFNRALSVYNHLVDIGVPHKFIKTESFGESRLISENHGTNRRARIYFLHESDAKSVLNPPKYIKIKAVDAKNNKVIQADLGFDYGDDEMKFSKTSSSGFSQSFMILKRELIIDASKSGYLTTYFKLPQQDLDTDKDTLTYTLLLNKVKVVGKLSFKNIYFYTDSDEIRPESSPDLYRLLATLKRNESAFVEIQGHMNYPLDRPNNSAQTRYNKELSFKRAKAINDYLITSGIDQSRLSYKGMSNSKMLYPYPSSTGQENMNKRVEIYLLKKL